METNVKTSNVINKSDNIEHLAIEDDKVYNYYPLPNYGEGIYKKTLVMDKDTFTKCYDKWIKWIKKEEVTSVVESPSSNKEEVRLKARWISLPHKKDRICSNCGHDEPYKFADKEAEIYRYCPHCGSEIDVTLEDKLRRQAKIKVENITNPCTSCPQQVDCWGLTFGVTENKQYEEGGCSDYLKWKDECKSMWTDDKIIKVSDNTEDNSILASYSFDYGTKTKKYYNRDLLVADIKKYGKSITEADIVRSLHDVKTVEAYTKEEVIKIINDIKSEIDKYCDYCYSQDEYPSKSHIDIIIKDLIDNMEG